MCTYFIFIWQGLKVFFQNIFDFLDVSPNGFLIGLDFYFEFLMFWIVGIWICVGLAKWTKTYFWIEFERI